MRRVVGLDLSLTKTGIGIITQRADGTCTAVADTITSRGRRADDLVARHARLTELGKAIVHHAATAELTVVEGPVPGAKGGSPVDRWGLWWWVVGGLIRRDVPVAVVAPTSLKLAIAGSGRADKASLAVALTRLYPDVDVTSSDVADSVGLAHLGAVHLGWPVKVLERHRQVKASWPEFCGGEAA
jgi:Holliday junction resolvasome RuvABC endonuclease subunit